MRGDSESRFGVVLAASLMLATHASAEVSADTPEQREYLVWAMKWARELGVTDRCYDEYSSRLIEEEAAAGALAFHPSFWDSISGARLRETEELAQAMKSAHAGGFSSDEPCFMSLMMRDSSRSLVETNRKLVELKQ